MSQPTPPPTPAIAAADALVATPRTNTACKIYGKVMERLVLLNASGESDQSLNENLQGLLLALVTTSAALERELIAATKERDEFRDELLEERGLVADWENEGQPPPTAPSHVPSLAGGDSARLDWLEKHLMSLQSMTSPDMSGIRYRGQAHNPAKERGEAGPSYIPLKGQTVRQAIDKAIEQSGAQREGG